MKYRILSAHPILLMMVGMLLVISACGGEAGQVTKPVATITSPQNGSAFSVGQKVNIAFAAADVKGIAQVELTIDNQPVRVQTVDPPVNSFVASEPWTPEIAGSHVIELRAFNVDGETSEPAEIVVIVNAPVAEAIPTLPPAEPTATPTVVVAPTPTFPPPSPTATVEPAAARPMVTALVGLNVRSGPGTNYPVIGRLAQGESAEIVGRNELSTWWQIVHPAAGDDRGWVAAGAEFSTASQTEGVPLAEIPSPPTAAPTSPPPTATPSPLKPTIFSFTADRYTIAPGESVQLSWDLANARAAYLRYNDVEEGVVAPGKKTVSPTKDTVYRLVARNDAGETVAELTIKVGGATPTPVPVYRDGKTRLAGGQSIDFDQGIVQQGVGSGADFLWDIQQKKIFPQGGAVGVLLGKVYDDISLTDCLSASYGQPIPSIDNSTRITGCYKTDEGRYGKFFVSEWDLAGNLTINWLTWNYRS